VLFLALSYLMCIPFVMKSRNVHSVPSTILLGMKLVILRNESEVQFSEWNKCLKQQQLLMANNVSSLFPACRPES